MQCVTDFIGNSFVVRRPFFASCLQQIIKSYASRHRKAFRRKHIPYIFRDQNHYQPHEIIHFPFKYKCFYEQSFHNHKTNHLFVRFRLVYFNCILFISLIKYLTFFIRFARVKENLFQFSMLKCS